MTNEFPTADGAWKALGNLQRMRIGGPSMSGVNHIHGDLEAEDWIAIQEIIAGFASGQLVQDYDWTPRV